MPQTEEQLTELKSRQQEFQKQIQEYEDRGIRIMTRHPNVMYNAIAYSDVVYVYYNEEGLIKDV